MARRIVVTVTVRGPQGVTASGANFSITEEGGRICVHGSLAPASGAAQIPSRSRMTAPEAHAFAELWLRDRFGKWAAGDTRP